MLKSKLISDIAFKICLIEVLYIIEGIDNNLLDLRQALYSNMSRRNIVIMYSKRTMSGRL